MKTLIVTPTYPPYARGGGGVVVQTLAHGLAKKGHETTVISGYYPKKTLSERPHRNCEGEVEIIWIPLMKMMEARYPQLRGSLPPNSPSLAFLKTIDYEGYNVIHLHGFGHLLIDYVNLVAKNPRRILTVHGFPKYVGKDGRAGFPLKLLYGIYRWTLGKQTLNSAKAITTVSKFVADECIKRGVPKSKVEVIPNGIELEKFKPVQSSELEEEFHLRDEDILVLSMMRISWQKGLGYALKAIHKVIETTNEPIKYMIVGPVEDRNYYSRLTRQIGKLGLKQNVIFTGFLSQKRLQALARANIFLAPSLHETFGLVVLEAMALGKPVIASDCEGFKCILEHTKTGLLVEPGNPVEMANAILTLLEKPELGKRLSNNAYYEVKKYDWKAIIRTYEELYRG